MATDVITIAYTSEPLQVDVVALLIGMLEYLFYGGVAYLFIALITELFFIVRTLELPSWRLLVRLFSSGSSVGLSTTLLLLSLLCFSLSLYFDFGRLILAIAWALLLLTVVGVISEVKPNKVLYLGTLKQSNMVFHCRMDIRVWPLSVLSYLQTGLDGDLGGVSINAKHKFLSAPELREQVKKAAAESAIVVVDASVSGDVLKDLLEILQSADLRGKPYIRIDDAGDHLRELTAMIKDFGFDGSFTTEKELLDKLRLMQI